MCGYVGEHIPEMTAPSLEGGYGKNKAGYNILSHSRCAPRLLPLYLRETHGGNIGKRNRSNTRMLVECAAFYVRA